MANSGHRPFPLLPRDLPTGVGHCVSHRHTTGRPRPAAQIEGEKIMQPAYCVHSQGVRNKTDGLSPEKCTPKPRGGAAVSSRCNSSIPGHRFRAIPSAFNSWALSPGLRCSSRLIHPSALWLTSKAFRDCGPII